jgi:hypothetical protein
LNAGVPRPIKQAERQGGNKTQNKEEAVIIAVAGGTEFLPVYSEEVENGYQAGYRGQDYSPIQE